MKAKSREEKLFSAAVVRRTLELNGEEYKAAYKFVYEGVLRDLGLKDEEVQAFLAEHRDEVEKALSRPGASKQDA